MKRKVKLVEIQIRHKSGDTPCFPPHQLREVFALMGEKSKDPVFKLILGFEDETGRHYQLTLREVREGEWILYGDSIDLPGFVEVARDLVAESG